MLARAFLLAALAFTQPAFASQPFDGAWSLSASAQNGVCGAQSFDIAIAEGRIQTPPGVAIAGSGRVTPGGVVSVEFIVGSDKISASGQARGGAASGRWSAPTLSCAGTWQAQRR